MSEGGFYSFLEDLLALWRDPVAGEPPGSRVPPFTDFRNKSRGFLAATATAVRTEEYPVLGGCLESEWHRFESQAHTAAAVATATLAASPFLAKGLGRIELRPDYERVTRAWPAVIAAAGLASALKHGKADAAKDWLRRAASFWIPDRRLPEFEIQGDWTGAGATFDFLLARGFPLLELRELTGWLAGHSPPSRPRVDMRVLFLDDRQGWTGTLRLELLDTGTGFIRSPRVLLIPCDAKFLGALEIARRYWERQGLSLKGAVCWDLTRGDFLPGLSDPPPMGIGPSLGGAWGVGLHLLAQEPAESDPSLAITAELRSESGDLKIIDGIRDKFQAALDAELQGQRRIHRLLVAKEQADLPTSLALPPALVASVQEALEVFHLELRPRRRLLEVTASRCRLLSLPGGGEEAIDAPLYRDLPLLQEVDPRSLDELDRQRSAGNDTPGSPTEASQVRWEEAQGRIRTFSHRTPLQELLAPGRRVIILGSPGCGKSTLLQHLAWKYATRASSQDEPPGSHTLPALIRLRDWETEVLRDPTHRLVDYLARSVLKQDPGESATTFQDWRDRWQGWLRSGGVLLLLDGLDEVGDPGFLAVVKSELRDYPECPAVVTCRSVSRGRLNAVGLDQKEYPIFTPAPFQPEDQDQYVDAYPFKSRRDRESLKEQLRRRSEFQFLATVPGLMAILCFVMDDAGNPPLPRTRTELYDAIITRLLNRPASRITPGGSLDTTDLENATWKRRVLEQLAFALSDRAEPQSVFSEDAVMSGIQEIMTAAGYTIAHAAWQLRDLRNNSWILVGESALASPGMSRMEYSFWHPTFREFLVASHLAREVEREGWTPSLADRIDRYCWMPQWEESIIFFGGMMSLRKSLRDTLPRGQERLEDGICALLELLADEERDDLFRHRLALAALCLPEVVS